MTSTGNKCDKAIRDVKFNWFHERRLEEQEVNFQKTCISSPRFFRCTEAFSAFSSDPAHLTHVDGGYESGIPLPAAHSTTSF